MSLVIDLEAEKHGLRRISTALNGNCLRGAYYHLLSNADWDGEPTTARAGEVPSTSKEDPSEIAGLMSPVLSGISLIPIPTYTISFFPNQSPHFNRHLQDWKLYLHCNLAYHRMRFCM